MPERLSQAQKEELLAQMPPELREQAKQISAIMADLGAICKGVLPPKDDPDAPVSQHDLIMGLAAAPSFHALGDHLVPETLDVIEKALISHGALGAGGLIVPAVDTATMPLKEIDANDMNNLTPAELYARWEDPSGKRSDAAIRRNALLIYWTMYKHKFGEDEVKLDPKTNVQAGLVNAITTKLLIRCQTVMPLQNRCTSCSCRYNALLSHIGKPHAVGGSSSRSPQRT